MTDDPADAAVLAEHARSLADEVDTTLAGWVVRCVEARWEQWRGEQASDELRAAAVGAGEEARREIGPRVRSQLEVDVDAQRANPLSILRRAVRFPTDLLRRAGVPPVVRDDQAVRLFPDDDYDLTPGSWADVDPALHEPGITWSAAKAHVVLARRRREGRR